MVSCKNLMWVFKTTAFEPQSQRSKQKKDLSLLASLPASYGASNITSCIEMTKFCCLARICPNPAKNCVSLVHFWCNHLQMSWKGGWKNKNQQRCLLLSFFNPFLQVILLLIVRNLRFIIQFDFSCLFQST